MSAAAHYCAQVARREATRTAAVDRFIKCLVATLGVLLTLLALSHCTPAPADELILHGPSHHFDRSSDFNNDNYGVGYAFDNGFVAGTYHNSIDNQTVYAGYVVRLHARVGIILGVATGYGIPVAPAAVLNLNMPLDKRWSLHLNILPIKQGVANLALGYQLGSK